MQLKISECLNSQKLDKMYLITDLVFTIKCEFLDVSMAVMYVSENIIYIFIKKMLFYFVDVVYLECLLEKNRGKIAKF